MTADLTVAPGAVSAVKNVMTDHRCYAVEYAGDGIPRRCVRVAFHEVTGGCVHEHLNTSTLCCWHITQTGTGLCALCRNAGHDCPKILLAHRDLHAQLDDAVHMGPVLDDLEYRR